MHPEAQEGNPYYLCRHIQRALDTKFEMSTMNGGIMLSNANGTDWVDWSARLTFFRTLERALNSLPQREWRRLKEGGIKFNLMEPTDWSRKNAHPSHANSSWPSFRWTKFVPETGQRHPMLVYFDIDNPTQLAQLMRDAR